MLPKVRRIFNNSNSLITNTKLASSADRLSDTSSSSNIEEKNNFYTETLLYVVPVAEMDATSSVDNQQHPDKLIGKVSKRMTARFNDRNQHQEDQTPKSSTTRPPLISFSNPFRRLNNMLKATHKSIQSPSTPKLNEIPLCSSTTRKSSLVFDQSHLYDRHSHEHGQLCPPPPPEFLSDKSFSIGEKRHSIRVDHSSLQDGCVDQNCYFDFNASDNELKKLVIAIDGPSKANIQIETIDKGVYRVHYKCSLTGNYQISVTYDGTHIDGSPFRLSLSAQPTQEDVRSYSITPIPVHIEPVEFYMNTPCVVNVRPTIRCDVFQAYIQTLKGKNNLPIMVHKSTKSEIYEIYFVPTTCGYHWLHVHLNHEPMLNNPSRLIVRSRSSLKSILTSKEEVFHAYTGESSQYFVSKSSSDRSSRRGDFSVGINGPSTVSLDANETEYGYEFHYKPMRSGRYSMAIKHGGKHIQGSPFLCRVDDTFSESRTTSERRLNVVSSSTTHVDLDRLRLSMTGDASKVCVFGIGLYEAKKRRKSTFKIDASQAGPGLLLVGLDSSLGSCERLVIKRIKSSTSAFTYKVSYRVRTRDQYLLTILYGSQMQHVPGSPYLVLVE